MKKVILLASLSIFGLGSFSAKSQMSPKTKGTAEMMARCYKYVYNSSGQVIGMVQVKCPDVIIP